VREGLAKVGRTPKIRCMFIEKEPGPYRALKAAVRDVTDIQIETLNGEFEHSIPEVLKFVGKGFSLVFIDPTAWTGFGLKQITPILQHLARYWSTSCLTTSIVFSTIPARTSPPHSLSYSVGLAGSLQCVPPSVVKTSSLNSTENGCEPQADSRM